MTDDVKYRSNDQNAGAVPVDTEIRTSPSTEAGHTDANIQHVFLDNKDGTAGEVKLSAVDNAVLDDIAANQTDGTQATKLVDESGVAYGVKHVDNKPRVSSTPYTYDIAEGSVAGHTMWTKSGYNPDVGTGPEDLWSVGGVYVFPTAEMGMEVISSSSDDAAAGTGVQKVKIYYLTSTGAEKSEEVTLNGTTAVPTVATDIYRVNAFRVSAVGTGLQAAGNIDVRHLTDTPVYSRISVGFTRARTLIYTVPAGKILYVTSVLFSAGSAVAGRSVRMITRATYDNLAGAVVGWFVPYTEAIVQDTATPIPLDPPTRLPAGTDIRVSAYSPDGATYADCILRGWIE